MIPSTGGSSVSQTSFGSRGVVLYPQDADNNGNNDSNDDDTSDDRYEDDPPTIATRGIDRKETRQSSAIDDLLSFQFLAIRSFNM